MKPSQEEKQREKILLFKEVFGSEKGEAVLHELMKSSFLLSPMATFNPTEMAYNEGRRSIVLQILQIIETDPERIMQLRKMGQSEEIL